jgi:hypothetical protein
MDQKKIQKEDGLLSADALDQVSGGLGSVNMITIDGVTGPQNCMSLIDLDLPQTMSPNSTGNLLLQQNGSGPTILPNT